MAHKVHQGRLSHICGLIRLKGLFNSNQLLLTSPKAISEALMSRNFLRFGIGDGLVVAEGAHHKHQRKHAMRSFTFRKIKNLYPLFWEKAVKMTKVIEQDTFGDQHSLTSTGFTDIDRWAPKATLDIIGIAGLGRDLNTLEHSEEQIASLLYDDIFTPTVGIRTVAALLGLVGSAEYAIFVTDLFVEGGTSFNCQVINQHETTSSTFTWIVFLLTLYPDVQGILESLLLFNCVCNETFRMFPPVPMTMRQSSRNITLIGQPIVAGTIITVAPWATGGVSTKYAFLTFLHEPRSRIGQGFARAELRALLAVFLDAFEWRMADPEEKIIPAIVITAKPKNGLNIKLKRARDCLRKYDN
ncbi:cytochrome P450 [Aspergillus foveolatus]|uniref:cytochrome P450 n=1 Tax=Aspergillus foveolatus TaxID=210207 RepID=UPI003CCD8C25